MVATPHTFRSPCPSRGSDLNRSLADGCALDGGRLAAFTESVLKLSLHSAEMLAAAGTDSLPADGLDGPVVSACLGASTTTGIPLLLLVPVGKTGLAGETMTLVVALALRSRSRTL